MTDTTGKATQPSSLQGSSGPVIDKPGSAADKPGSDADQTGKETGEPKPKASPWQTTIFGVYLLVLSVFLFYLLLKLMPGIATDTTTPGNVSLFGMNWPKVWPETRFILLALCAGALGSFIHTATSFADFVGNQQLIKSWLWWYLLRPLIGSCLAVTFYFAIRAGLISFSQGTSALNAFGVVSMSALAGMFAKQATDKLREVFENLLQAKPAERADPLKAAEAAAGASAGAAAGAAAGGKK